MKVMTTIGLIDREALTVKDIVSEDDNSRVVATEWYLGDELVRREAWVALLRPMELTSGG